MLTYGRHMAVFRAWLLERRSDIAGSEGLGAKAIAQIGIVFLGRLLDEFECFVWITWHSLTLCVQVAQSGQRSRTSSIRCLANPVSGFFVTPFHSRSLKIENSEIEFGSSETRHGSSQVPFCSFGRILETIATSLK